jgi:hypothetical protein
MRIEGLSIGQPRSAMLKCLRRTAISLAVVAGIISIVVESARGMYRDQLKRPTNACEEIY